MKKDSKILIVGDRNLIGARLVQYFQKEKFTHIYGDRLCSLDVLDQHTVQSFFQKTQPEYVFLTHIKHGGIKGNLKSPGEFTYYNLQVQANIIHYSYVYPVKKLLYFASSCSYPKDCPQPMKEEYLLQGELERTSEEYAISKIAGIELCHAYNKQYGTRFVPLIPATAYGPEDHFDTENSHVIASLIKRFHEAKEAQAATVTVWGTGNQRREFVYVDDMIETCRILMDRYDETALINVGAGEDVSIKELAFLIKDIIGFKGKIVFDPTQPEGPPQKLLDVHKLSALGWKPKTTLAEGIQQTYAWFLRNKV